MRCSSQQMGPNYSGHQNTGIAIPSVICFVTRCNTCQLRSRCFYTTKMCLLRSLFILFVVVQLTTLCHCAGIKQSENEKNKLDGQLTENPGTSPTLPSSEPSTDQSAKPEPTEPPKPTSSVVLNFANNFGYDWYPLNSDNKLCNDVKNLTDCTGGLACLVNGLLLENKQNIPLLSAGNTLTDSTAKGDLLKVLKFDPASKALNVLLKTQLKALVMGSDVYRYGSSLANKFSESVKVKDIKDEDFKMLACNLNSTAQGTEPFKPFVDINVANSNSCGIRVIGFANAEKMDRLRPENITVTNEIEAITRTIASEPRGKKLIVVMGEGTPELAKNISAIEDVDLVIISGSNVTAPMGNPLEKVTEYGRVKYILTNALVGLAQVTVKLLDDCKIADGTEGKQILTEKLNSTSEKCKIADKTLLEEVEAAITAGFSKYKRNEEELSVKLVNSISSEECHQSECTLGSIAADAVARAAAAENKDFPLDSRAVLLPAGIFKSNVTLTEPVTQKTLMDLLVDDEVFYNVNLTAEHLKAILEAMLDETGVNFPQLSGFRLFADLEGDDGQKVELLHILRNHLVFENIVFDESTIEYRVILPLNFLLRSGIKNMESYPYNVTGVFLSEALSSFFHSESLGGYFLPPPLGERITYVLPPTQQRCENLIAITVCYTFLAVITVTSVLLLGYKIYSDRTAVHYVR